MSGISTHVLDTSLGRPAAGITVMAERQSGDTWQKVGEGTTDADGRIAALVAPPLQAGDYRLTFHTGAYFSARGQMAFYPQVVVLVHVHEAQQRYHIPLLLSPFGYSTYRGS
jgi:5-hydroxyisourate hydrolase